MTAKQSTAVLSGFVPCLLLALSGCLPGPGAQPAHHTVDRRPANPPYELAPQTRKIVDGAIAQLQDPAAYSGAYYSIGFPGGDVPQDRGACTDVVVRAFRKAGIDLQVDVNTAIRAGWVQIDGRPDTNIDHRRCPNLRALFAHKGWTVAKGAPIQAGDVVFWKLADGTDHTGIVSDQKSAAGAWMVDHNIGPTVALEDCIDRWAVAAVFRPR